MSVIDDGALPIWMDIKFAQQPELLTELVGALYRRYDFVGYPRLAIKWIASEAGAPESLLLQDGGWVEEVGIFGETTCHLYNMYFLIMFALLGQILDLESWQMWCDDDGTPYSGPTTTYRDVQEPSNWKALIEEMRASLEAHRYKKEFIFSVSGGHRWRQEDAAWVGAGGGFLPWEAPNNAITFGLSGDLTEWEGATMPSAHCELGIRSQGSGGEQSFPFLGTVVDPWFYWQYGFTSYGVIVSGDTGVQGGWGYTATETYEQMGSPGFTLGPTNGPVDYFMGGIGDGTYPRPEWYEWWEDLEIGDIIPCAISVRKVGFERHSSHSWSTVTLHPEYPDPTKHLILTAHYNSSGMTSEPIGGGWSGSSGMGGALSGVFSVMVDGDEVWSNEGGAGESIEDIATVTLDHDVTILVTAAGVLTGAWINVVDAHDGFEDAHPGNCIAGVYADLSISWRMAD